MGNQKSRNKSSGQTKYVLITAGRGPVECHWVVTQVLKLVLQEIKDHRLDFEVIERVKGGQPNALASVFLKVIGKLPTDFLKDWEGSLQWIGKSPYRKFHKRKNWFIGLSVLEFKQSSKWKESDLEIQPFKASGPGGQHRNKVESAIRVIHKPSGLSVTCTDSRSQHQNRKVALQRFADAFVEHELQQAKKQLETLWREHLNIERGNPVKVLRGTNFKTIN